MNAWCCLCSTCITVARRPSRDLSTAQPTTDLYASKFWHVTSAPLALLNSHYTMLLLNSHHTISMEQIPHHLMKAHHSPFTYIP